MRTYLRPDISSLVGRRFSWSSVRSATTKVRPSRVITRSQARHIASVIVLTNNRLPATHSDPPPAPETRDDSHTSDPPDRHQAGDQAARQRRPVDAAPHSLGATHDHGGSIADDPRWSVIVHPRVGGL